VGLYGESCRQSEDVLQLLTELVVRRVFLAVVAAVLLAACAGPGGEKVVFPHSAGALSSGVSPTGQIINLGLAPLHNSSSSSVRIQSVRLVGAARGVRVVSVTAYLWRQVGLGALIGYIGDLPKTCPRQFTPHPVTDAVTPARSDSRWMVVVAVRFARPGHYDFRNVKITYTTRGQEGWQYMYEGVDVTAVRPSGKVDPTGCP
jgi:hypothetical protein